jgi:hypothetical protein
MGKGARKVAADVLTKRQRAFHKAAYDKSEEDEGTK